MFKKLLTSSIESSQLVVRRFLAAPSKSGSFAGAKLGGSVSKKSGQQTSKKVELEVESDPNKLVKFCCGLNIYKTGGEEVPLKADSEYPEWLWKLSVDGAPPLEEMEKDTLQYWVRKRKIQRRYKISLMKRQYPEPFIPKKVKNLKNLYL